jgi:hypothetical protein
VGNLQFSISLGSQASTFELPAPFELHQGIFEDLKVVFAPELRPRRRT